MLLLRKLKRRITTIVPKPSRRNHRKTTTTTSPPTSSHSPPDAFMSPPQAALADIPHFPPAHSTVLPNPAAFFAPELLSAPLPTNSFFQNFVLNNGDQPEYVHPYLVKSSQSRVAVCYPSLFKTAGFFYQIFAADIVVSTLNNPDPNARHVISKFTDLSVTLDLPSSHLRFPLVRGSPYLTFKVRSKVALSFSTAHSILDLIPKCDGMKYTIKLNNAQTWLLYASSPIELRLDGNAISSSEFSGLIRIAVLPNDDVRSESILDRFSSCYPVGGEAIFNRPFGVDYRWDKRGSGNLLILAHPLHRRLLSKADSYITILEHFNYKSIDGELVGIVADSWAMKTEPIPVTWHSKNGVKKEYYSKIIGALNKDVVALDSSSISTTSLYFYGKLIARAARLALIAEEVSHHHAIPAIEKFLKETIEPWMNGTFSDNGFLYDTKWGGIVTKQGSSDLSADFGFGIFNNHHYHLGYFLYGISVLAKIDPAWGRKHMPQAYSLMANFMNLDEDSVYPRLRCFDPYKLHSWAGGLTEFADGRNQQSTSEAVNGYYSAALMGLAYGDDHLFSRGSTLAALEIEAAKTWWHVRDKDGLCPTEFARENRMVGVLWSSKRDGGLWFTSRECRECRLGIQVLPLVPISEVLFSDVGFVRELVNWAAPALKRGGVGEGWKGFVAALRGVYDGKGGLESIEKLKGFDDGNSLSNLLWWIFSRPGVGL